MTFNPRLPCATRNGRKVEILAVLPLEKMTQYGETIVALVYDRDGHTSVETYRSDGAFDPKPRPSMWDLVNTAIPVVTPEQYAAMTEAETKQFVTQAACRIRAVVSDRDTMITGIAGAVAWPYPGNKP